MIFIRKNSRQYRQWLKKRNLRNLKKRSQRKSTIAKQNHTYVEHYSTIRQVSAPTKKDEWRRITVEAPSHFSLIDNTTEVTSFFDDVSSYLRLKRNEKVDIVFDLSKVQVVTIDAIMYLLALIKNLQKKNLMADRHFSGNMPINAVAKQMFEESGFLNFVNSTVPAIKTNANKIAIRTGESNDSKVLKEICDFIIEKANSSRIKTTFLYVMMAEMMYNTYEHAYDITGTVKNWYIFVELVDDRIKFTFLDTGLGIPKTMRKNLSEKLLKVSEDKLILSALSGADFRSQTKLYYRNNGLPTIRRYAETHKIENLRILSHKAVCLISYEEDKRKYKTHVQEKPLLGTLYYWEVPLKIIGDIKND